MVCRAVVEERVEDDGGYPYRGVTNYSSQIVTPPIICLIGPTERT